MPLKTNRKCSSPIALRTRPIRPILSCLHRLNNHLLCPFHTLFTPSNDNRVVAVSSTRDVNCTPRVIAYDSDFGASLADDEVVVFGRDAKISNAVSLVVERGNDVFKEFFCFLDVCVGGATEFPGDSGVVGWVDRVVYYLPGILFFVVVVDSAEDAVGAGFQWWEVSAFVADVDLEFLAKLDFCATVVGETVMQASRDGDCNAIAGFHNVLLSTTTLKDVPVSPSWLFDSVLVVR